MSVSLSKGQSVNLSKEAPSLKKAVVGLGWDPTEEGKDIDLDASVLLLDANGKVRNDSDFIYFKNLESADGSVLHTGDNLTGEGDGDDEQIKINLEGLPADVKKVVIVINSYSGQTFGEVKNAFARVYNEDTNEEAVKYDLDSKFNDQKAVRMAELTRTDNGWEFQAIGEAADKIETILNTYGVNVG